MDINVCVNHDELSSMSSAGGKAARLADVCPVLCAAIKLAGLQVGALGMPTSSPRVLAYRLTLISIIHRSPLRNRPSGFGIRTLTVTVPLSASVIGEMQSTFPITSRSLSGK